MPKSPLPKLIPALLLVAALLALPAAANATLAYSTNVFHPHVWVAKNDNGKGAKAIGAGSNAKVSPDGELVVFEREGAKGKGPEMKLYDLATGKTKTIFSPWREPFTFAWSPDSTLVAALGGSEIGKQTLYVVDVETGKKTRIAGGYFNGVSFSPDSKEVVFGLAATESYPRKSDVIRAPVAGGPTSPLTHDKISAYPLWGPTGQIVFVKLLGAKQRQYGPKNELFLMKRERQRGQAAHPHQGRPAHAGALPGRLVVVGEPAADQLRRPGHPIRRHRQSEDGQGDQPQPEQLRDRLRRRRPDHRRQDRARLPGRLRRPRIAAEDRVGPRQRR